MNERIVVVGAGGFGREVLDVIDAVNASASTHGGDTFDLVGFVDDGAPDLAKLDAYGVEHLGPVQALLEMPADVGYVIGIGAPATRASLDEALDGRHSPVLVHPTATLGRRVNLGPGTIVCAHVAITNHITLGRHVHVNLSCTIGHDAVLGDYVTMSPLVAISGNVVAEERAFFGTGSKVNPGLNVGAGATVGTGAAVIRDVPAGATVVGVPAKPR